MRFDLPVGLCPKCHEEGIELYATWAKNGKEITCSRGHYFANDNDFGKNISKQERKKLEKESNKIMSKIFNQEEEIKGGNFAPEPAKTPAVEQRLETDIVLDDVNKARLESLLGEFADASTLVGRVFAAMEEKKDLQDLIKNAKKLKVGEEDGKVLAGGDLELKCIIPERHVQPLMDMAHGWSASTTRYFNERLTGLLDDMLFY